MTFLDLGVLPVLKVCVQWVVDLKKHELICNYFGSMHLNFHSVLVQGLNNGYQGHSQPIDL